MNIYIVSKISDCKGEYFSDIEPASNITGTQWNSLKPSSQKEVMLNNTLLQDSCKIYCQ